MSLKAPSSGGNYLEIFDLTLTSSGTTNIITTGAFGTSAFAFDKSLTTKVTGHPLKQSLKIELESKIFSSALETFYSNYMTNTAVEQVKITYEDNTEDTIVTQPANSKTFGFALYTGISGGSRAVYIGRGCLSGATGDASFQSKNVGSYPAEITVLDGIIVTCGSNKLSTSKITGAADVTMAATEFGTIKWLASA